ncbi:MAG: YegS/Rv2252/BmrU family lipid kinase [Chloroflexi bacterium]|nr:YegS/Rv2252/BmrU family lipid kinase [Chloroflexota bacterium]
MDALLIHNPVAGDPHKHEALGLALNELRSTGWRVDAWETKRRGHSFDLAQKAVRAGYRILIVAGGDGSIQQTIDGIIQTGSNDTRLGIIPLGTGNVFARDVGLPVPRTRGDGATARAAQIILKGDAIPVDIGIAGDHAFLCWAGMGIDAAATAAVEANLEFKRRAPIFTYAIAALKAIYSYQPGQIQVDVDGEEQLHGSFPLVVASNIALYARWLQISPDALIDDGLLDLIVFTSPHPLHLFLTVLKMFINPHTQTSDLIRRSCKTIHIQADFSAPCHLDGDPVDTTPFTITVQPRRLPIFLDRNQAQRRLKALS